MKKQLGDSHFFYRESYEIGKSSDGEAPTSSSKMQVYIVHYTNTHSYIHIQKLQHYEKLSKITRILLKKISLSSAFLSLHQYLSY